MAKNHTCTTVNYIIDGKPVSLSFIKTAAGNIKIMSFSRKQGRKTKKAVGPSGEYGINASWFANGGDNHIMNVAFQDGVRQGYFLDEKEVPASGGVQLDGYANSVGGSAICYKNGAVSCETDVTSSDNDSVAGSTWVQGGLGLYLGHADWRDLFVSEGNGAIYISGAAHRSALVVKTDTNMAYLMASHDDLTVAQFRTAIMRTFVITDGGGNPDNPYVRGILLDGGGSTQLVGSAVSLPSTRPIPQIVALVDKS